MKIRKGHHFFTREYYFVALIVIQMIVRLLEEKLFGSLTVGMEWPWLVPHQPPRSSLKRYNLSYRDLERVPSKTLNSTLENVYLTSFATRNSNSPNNHSINFGAQQCSQPSPAKYAPCTLNRDYKRRFMRGRRGGPSHIHVQRVWQKDVRGRLFCILRVSNKRHLPL